MNLSKLTFRASVAALEGRRVEAIAMFRDALNGWAELGLPWDEAMTGIDMAMTLGPDEPAVVAAATSARSILERLGAAAMLAQLDAAMAGKPAKKEPAAGRKAPEGSSV